MVMSYQPRRSKGTTEKPPRKYAIKEVNLTDGTINRLFFIG